MAEDGSSAEDRTEAATSRHLEQARESGRVPVSREVATFAGLATVALMLVFLAPDMERRIASGMIAFFRLSGRNRSLDASSLADMVARASTPAIAVILAAAIAGGAAVIVQTGFLLHLGALAPNLGRINPLQGIKRSFGTDGLVEFIKSQAKLALLGSAIWLATVDDGADLQNVLLQNPGNLPVALGKLTSHVFVAVLSAQGLIAGGDLIWVRFKYAHDLRMTKQDIRDELKDTEGNPHVKARLRRIRFLRARQRMMTKVPTATVVVTNPTHYAVALAYDRTTNPAPRLVAKGADSLAARIREVAVANGVPVVANPLLARALYRLELDTEIPAEHYKAVAAIVAYVWRLRRPAPNL